MLATSFQLLGFCVLSWSLWRLAKLYRKIPLHNVRGPKAESWIMGDLEKLLDRHRGWDFHQEIADTYGAVARLQGLFGAQTLYVADPLALRQLLVKEEDSYDYSAHLIAVDKAIFGPGLLSVSGSRHRHQRKMLNPIFAVQNIRNMTPLFYAVTRKLRDAIAELVKDEGRDVDVMLWLTRAALEFIAQGGMGHSFDPLLPDVATPNAMGEALKGVMPVSYDLSIWRMVANHFESLGTPKLRRALVDLTCAILPDTSVGKMRTIIDTMYNTSSTIFRDRLASLQESKLSLNSHDGETDIMSILLRANIQSTGQQRLTKQELIAQMTTMLFAGTDTTSNVVSRVLHKLAEQPEWQERLREELADARNTFGEEIPYDDLLELPLLNAVCRETLRCYPPTNITPREALTDTILPLMYPIEGADGTMISEIAVPKGTPIFTNFTACNLAKNIWGNDAREWKPERWLAPLPDTVMKAQMPGIYSNLMTFGAGPRACIGFRFAELEMRVVLSMLLDSFEFSLTDKDIVWNLSGVSFPSMDKESLEPSLELKIRAIPRT